MDTEELIQALAGKARPPGTSLSTMWWRAAGLATTLAAIMFFATLEPRPDLATAAETPRFLFKIAVAIILAFSAFGLVRALSRPGEGWHRAVWYLGFVPLLAAIGVMAELLSVPPDMWAARLLGADSLACLMSIMLIGIGPLAVSMMVLRYGAPTKPIFAGAVAGLFAGGIAATLYAIHCPDDSPLFVATWYSVAIAALALIGAGAAHRVARW
jgi:hypothetical protein